MDGGIKDMSDIAQGASTSPLVGWRGLPGGASLAEVNGSVSVGGRTGLRRLLAFVGPGYLVAVGYMDPGNWATSLAGGSKFGYALMAVVALSSMMAMLLQALCARLGVATGRDLAQACRDAFPKAVAYPLWLLAEAAICATDLAEVIGTAIGLNLLFHIPLELGVVITALDVFLVLLLQRVGFRFVEAFVIGLLLVIAACFAVQLAMADPDFGAIIRGLAPTTDLVTNPDMLYIALGIVGATVMPHNLYLHSSIVQTRGYKRDPAGKREAIRYATTDSTIALVFAFVVNASILILAAAAFHANGRTEVAELGQAHTLLGPLLGGSIAASAFGLALLCCGLNSTVTATLSGQVVMEGFLRIRLAPWARRLITRAIAIAPAIVVTLLYGESGTAKLLVMSQVVLSLQLPFAVIPLVWFTASRSKMGEFVAPRWMSIAAGLVASVIVALNVKLVFDFATGS